LSLTSGTLEHAIRRRILGSSHQRIPFPEYMAMALTAYYGSIAIDASGFADFCTGPIQFSPHFGRAIGEIIISIFQKMETSFDHTIVAMGEGNGVMLRDALDFIRTNDPALYVKLRVIIIENSPGLSWVQRQTLRKHHTIIAWREQNVYSSELPKIHGVFISNELPDTFPVHLVSSNENCQLGEEWVRSNPDLFPGIEEFEGLWVPGISPEIVSYIAKSGKSIPKRVKVPVNLNSLQWMRAVTESLIAGAHIIIDYGFSGTSYPTGNLIWTVWNGMCGESPYWEPGRRDITSFVDFDLLKMAGEEAGAETVFLGTEEQLFQHFNCAWKPPSHSEDTLASSFLALVQIKQ
ncbi:MAG: SAM-dependent methyltransferase, partial [Candidatus Margulisbacteria bacterium]|nr:SAM-dependent methyltransferase [Candidatus Margulisiibacteriota bacterium]